MKSQALTLFDLVERLSLLTRADLRQAGAAQGLQPVHLQVLFYLNQAQLRRVCDLPPQRAAGAAQLFLRLDAGKAFQPRGAADLPRTRAAAGAA
ncbi:MAG: hypothetical protein J0626_05705 [Rhodospirillaceae bacterium]|nr:hypothetical protein [Rhodospirillaceae bacterium]